MSDLLPQLQPQANYIIKKGQMFCVSITVSMDGIYVYCLLCLGCQNFVLSSIKIIIFCVCVCVLFVLMDELKHKIALMN